MNLADKVDKRDDNFRITLNWRGKFTFSQEPCRYAGEDMLAYNVPFAGMDYYLLAPANESRDSVFESFETFIANMLRYVDPKNNPYTAVLVLENGKLNPIITIDVSHTYQTQEVMLVFGMRGEIAVLGYDCTDLRERLKNAFSNGVDLNDVRNGNEKVITETFGAPDLTEIMPPEEKDDERNSDGCRVGDDVPGGGPGGDGSGGDPVPEDAGTTA